jgi:hypothetical protein
VLLSFSRGFQSLRCRPPEQIDSHGVIHEQLAHGRFSEREWLAACYCLPYLCPICCWSTPKSTSIIKPIIVIEAIIIVIVWVTTVKRIIATRGMIAATGDTANLLFVFLL